jgi:hypothetical protein
MVIAAGVDRPIAGIASMKKAAQLGGSGFLFVFLMARL